VPKDPNRPELRLVYDAGAKYCGRCLNDYLISGPALKNPLPSVIIKFRKRSSRFVGGCWSHVQPDSSEHSGWPISSVPVAGRGRYDLNLSNI
jgi:hypothetical protein